MQELYYPEESPFEKLPNRQVFKILEDYTNPDIAVAEIIADLNVNAHNLYRRLPFVLSNTNCEKCDELIHTKPKIRSAQNRDEKLRYCTNCGHNYTENCDCEDCVAEREQRQEEQEKLYRKNRTEFQKKWEKRVDDTRPKPYEISEISLLEETYLYLILVEIIFNTFYSGGRGDLKNNEITFKEDSSDEIQNYVKSLIGKGILAPSYSPNFDLDCSNVDDRFEFRQNNSSQFNINDSTLFNPPILGTKCIINIKNIGDLELFFHDHLNREHTEEEKEELFYHVYHGKISCYFEEINTRYLSNNLDLYLMEGLIHQLFINFPLVNAFHLIRTTASNAVIYETTESSEPADLTKYFLAELHKSIQKNIGNPNVREYKRSVTDALSNLEKHIINEILCQPSYDQLSLKRILNSPGQSIPEKIVVDKTEEDTVPF